MREPTRALRAAGVAATTLAVVLTLAGATPQAVADTYGPAAAIEGYAGYEPQTKCKPKAKRGTKALAAWLQKEYDGTGSSGISRPCSSGGTSEHKEGRAFDWRIDVSSKRDRGYAKNLLERLFATDADGNTHALARRMGIMYVLWNDASWASYRGFAKQAYLHSSCKSRKKCSKTLRHRDHMHISLSRAGGAGKTSWYADPDAYTPPKDEPNGPKVLDLSKRSYAKIGVSPDGTVTKTKYALKAGTTYRLTAAGLYGYGSPQQVADPACVWSAEKRGWVSRPGSTTLNRHGSLDLVVNGKRLFGNTCRGSHTYATTFKPTRTQPLTVKVANQADGSYGRLRLLVSRKGSDVSGGLPDYPKLRRAPEGGKPLKAPHGLVAESVALRAERAGGATLGGLSAGVDYRMTVSGTVSLGRGVKSDGMCVATRGEWHREAAIDLRVPGQDHGNLYVDGEPFIGTGGCGSRTHTTTFTADDSGRVRLALWDPLSRADNKGSLRVSVQRLTAVKAPIAAPSAKPKSDASWTDRREFLRLDVGARHGRVSAMRVRKGEEIQVAVTGTHRSNQRRADAACVRTSKGWTTKDPAVALDQDLLNLWVDGTQVSWRAVGETTPCSADHTYVATFVAEKNGPLRLALLDLDTRDNDGQLKVTLLRA